MSQLYFLHEAGPPAHSRLLRKPVSPCTDMIRELPDAQNESLFISASLEPSWQMICSGDSHGAQQCPCGSKKAAQEPREGTAGLWHSGRHSEFPATASTFPCLCHYGASERGFTWAGMCEGFLSVKYKNQQLSRAPGYAAAVRSWERQRRYSLRSEYQPTSFFLL